MFARETRALGSLQMKQSNNKSYFSNVKSTAALKNSQIKMTSKYKTSQGFQKSVAIDGDVTKPWVANYYPDQVFHQQLIIRH